MIPPQSRGSTADSEEGMEEGDNGKGLLFTFSWAVKPDTIIGRIFHAVVSEQNGNYFSRDFSKRYPLVAPPDSHWEWKVSYRVGNTTQV